MVDSKCKDMGCIIKVKFIVKLLGMGLGMEIMPCMGLFLKASLR